MATNLLNKKFDSMYVTKTVGGQRIKEAQDNNEDCAILTTFLPPGFEPETKNMFFECALKHKCFLGNSKLKTPGNEVWTHFIKLFILSDDVQCKGNMYYT